MINSNQHQIIYGAYAHSWQREISSAHTDLLTLDKTPEAELDRLQELGINWLWLIGLWQTGPHGRAHAISHPDLRRECQRLLGNLTLADMIGSPYAINQYRVHRALGGDGALEKLRRQLEKRHIRLMLDFVPNHLACDHPWVAEHPDYFVQGALADLEPRHGLSHGFFAETKNSQAIFFHGRDPNFGPWTDTVQIDWRNPALIEAMTNQINHLSTMCDGLRCDMAMLILNDIFRRTWGAGNYPPPKQEPWIPLINAARKNNPHFVFLAEVYWGMEEKLINLGFDWVYDKVLYDRLRYDSADNLKIHLNGNHKLAANSLSFLENHDEPRAAAVFDPGRHEAAAIIAATLPGPFFIHQGQMEGRREKLPIQLGRLPLEKIDQKRKSFYQNLLKNIRGAHGSWCSFECCPAWSENHSTDQFVVHGWCGENENLLACVNFSPSQAQCYVNASQLNLKENEKIIFRDLLNDVDYQRPTNELRAHGLYVELPAWGAHLFRFGIT